MAVKRFASRLSQPQALRCPQRRQRLDSAEYITNTFPYAEILTSDDN